MEMHIVQQKIQFLEICINANNVKEYLACDKILACGGSWMVKGDLVKAGEFDKITEMVREAANIVKEIRG